LGSFNCVYIYIYLYIYTESLLTANKKIDALYMYESYDLQKPYFQIRSKVNRLMVFPRATIVLLYIYDNITLLQYYAQFKKIIVILINVCPHARRINTIQHSVDLQRGHVTWM
jgi:hypothetical protein